jgi:8-oxo-dGTP pyrophosphatase MutT (NUDIX family)
MMDARAFQHRLLQRLAGSQPNHLAEHTRIGARLSRGSDERLLAMMPRESRAAAVLIGLQEHAGEPAILLTVRAGHLRKHAGQIAFPGGAIDALDKDPAEAALREAREEVGLLSSQARVAGYLPDQVVLTGFRITPVVALIEPRFTPSPDHTEVQEAFMLPVSALLDSSNHLQGRRSIGGEEFEVRDLAFGSHLIWGATAGMLFELYELGLA